MRTFYGIRISGTSGSELLLCHSNTTARRIRRVVKLWKEEGGFDGIATLEAIAALAAKSPGIKATTIVKSFREINDLQWRSVFYPAKIVNEEY